MNKYLEKIAYDLQQHQERVASRIEKGESLIAAHSVGSGKTLTALESAARVQKKFPDKDIVIVVPAALTENFDKEIDKHGIKIDRSRLHIYSYEMAQRRKDEISDKKISLVIMDEAHRGRNLTSERAKFIRWLGERSDQTLMLTGTPNYNKPSDIAVLTNTLAKEQVLPENPKDFNKKFTDTVEYRDRWYQPATQETILKNKEALRDVLGKYVDFHSTEESDPTQFPTSKTEVKEIPMSKQQLETYKYLEGRLPAHLRKKVREGLPLTKQELSSLNAFSTGIRQASNSVEPYLQLKEKAELTPKIQAMVESLKKYNEMDKNFKGVVYSNYLDAGLRPLSAELKRAGIKHEVFDGSINAKQRKKIVDNYNKKKTKVLLISSSGSEGLDLKGTRLVQIMEPHFNEEKVNQVVGRAVRYKSHEGLPEKDRNVLIEKYHSIFPHKDPSFWGKFFGAKPVKDKSIDQYLTGMSRDKKGISEQVLDQAREGFKRRQQHESATASIPTTANSPARS